ncbi:MAG: AAA family ATPase [Halothiobacillaceae bacterium]|uniref:AAA family ATPase n=1 Tax=Chitinibacter tainanensis TaxID=230667 RepID=UPI002354C1A8|nr:AAA family ATPase [Chitinibacter tainanensis]
MSSFTYFAAQGPFVEKPDFLERAKTASNHLRELVVMNPPRPPHLKRLLWLAHGPEAELIEEQIVRELDFPPPDDLYADELMDTMDALFPDHAFLQKPPGWFISLQDIFGEGWPTHPPRARLFHLPVEPESEQLCACRLLASQHGYDFMVIDRLEELSFWESIDISTGGQVTHHRALVYVRHLDLTSISVQQLLRDSNMDFIVPREILPEGWSAHVLTLGYRLPPVLHEDGMHLVDPIRLQRQIDTLKDRQASMLAPLILPKPLQAATLEVCQNMQDWCAQLGAESHLRAVLETICAQTKVRTLGGKPLGFRPILLTGEPGNSKSWVCGQIAEVLGLPRFKIDMAGNGDQMLLVGSSPNWQNACPGRIAQFLAESEVANPIIVIEEVDKVLKDRDNGLQDVLLMLLEPENSQAFQDNFIVPPLNLSHVSFILTSNTTDGLGAPLLSRVEQIGIRRPNPEQLLAMARQLYSRIVQEMGVQAYFTAELPDSLALQLATRSRSIRTLQLNIQSAVEAAVQRYSLPELLAHQHNLQPCLPPQMSIQPAKQAIGFLP